ncbi:protein KRTCAP2 homolog [Schistocerca americana]|uniref:protein KRTCAP2 homolog n=1 Tax=Schistocerca americana TaxID=7009 RepID=UPI001F4FF7FE|nr:protein KRTCAP2 homolog [Schistocerca americana]XP_047109770.1 protein KRTCAP2 homolog [Schistocerca piceifrons]XP_049764720.1 protein KRTCAP2 homolog [Schistocerca cancellata]XP_049804025.1 protein KRTCAP2 homolog [Schistocerca nitens]XP_049838203.1 protein KRTCAP2 homolog [Schistocerca gregaria]XP_049838204.1 protein KRTCAP2 homolog [Schistocerca gregaria]XP_049941485.1 protein KRTCAP2 homolog [Schistocerca serialis cubense]
MAVSSGMSFAIASLLTVLLFSGMQMNRQWLASSQVLTLVGGWFASMLFELLLIAVGNLESALFGKGFQTTLFPEVVLCLAIAMVSAGMIHRVCTTTCLLFSLVALYYMNRISQATYAAPAPVQPVVTKKKK